MEILINTNQQDGAKSAALLKAVDKFEDDLEDRFELITRVNSLATATKESNKSMHSGSNSYYKIPDTDQEVSNLMFNFESADPETRKLMVDDLQILRLNIT